VRPDRPDRSSGDIEHTSRHLRRTSPIGSLPVYGLCARLAPEPSIAATTRAPLIAPTTDTYPSKGETSRSMAAGLLLVGAAIIMLGEALARSDRPTSAVIWGSLALSTYAAGLLCLIGALRHADLGVARWKLGPWMLLWYGVVFGIATITWSRPQVGTSAEISISSVLKALVLVAVAITAWAVGYCIGPSQPVLAAARRPIGLLNRWFTAEIRSPAAPWILYAIGIGARLASVATTGQFGYVGDSASAITGATSYRDILAQLSLCAPLAVAAAATQVYQERSAKARITLGLLFLIELGFGAAAGAKASFVITALAVIIPFSVSRGRLPKKVIFALLLLFLLIIVPFNQAYRTIVNQSPERLTPIQSIAGMPTILEQTAKAASSALPSSFDYLAQRISEISNVAIIIQRTPQQVPFINPAQLAEASIAGMVPRAIWPTKPIMITGLKFSEQFYDLPPTTSSADTVVGGLYWYGGWLPVLIGMFLLGCGVRLLDGILDVRAHSHAIFLVLLLFISIVGGENDFAAILVSVPPALVVWFVAVFLTFKQRREHKSTVLVA
jgi:hypothetical protein